MAGGLPERLKVIFSSEKPNFKRTLIPDGHFIMGTKGDTFDEGPAHRVYVSAFEMAQMPVTNRDYAIYLKKTKAEPPPQWDDPAFDDPEQPVVGVNWLEAQQYCEWLSEQAKMQIRLPTEAEFEKAARAGLQGMAYPWGNDRARGGYEVRQGPLKAPYRCGANPPNGYGLYDMVSNVHQWCLDGYDPDFYGSSPERDPIGPDTTDQRAARGRSWKEEELVGRCAARARLAPYFRVDDFGFRWVVVFRREESY